MRLTSIKLETIKGKSRAIDVYELYDNSNNHSNYGIDQQFKEIIDAYNLFDFQKTINLTNEYINNNPNSLYAAEYLKRFKNQLSFLKNQK